MEIKITEQSDKDFVKLMAHALNQLDVCNESHVLAMKHIDNKDVVLKCTTCKREYGFSRRMFDQLFTWKERAKFTKQKHC